MVEGKPYNLNPKGSERIVNVRINVRYHSVPVFRLPDVISLVRGLNGKNRRSSATGVSVPRGRHTFVQMSKRFHAR